MLWSPIVQNNVVYPYYVELALGLPGGSPKSVERQVDLVFAILTQKLDAATDDARRRSGRAATSTRPSRPPARRARRSSTRGKRRDDGASESTRSKQLEIENLHLKQLVGNLSLADKLLFDRLAALEPAAKD